MPAIGPRVGGAHVDVNLKFDEKSLAAVGKKIHKQLSSLTDNLAAIGERNRRVYQEIGKSSVTAWRSLVGAVVAGAPLVGSALSGVTGAAALLAGSFQSLGQASAAFAPLLLAVGVAGGTAALGLRSFFKALKDGDLSGLTPSAKAAAQSVQGLAGAWQRVRDTVQENLFRGLADDIARLGTTFLPVLERGLGKMATALNGLAQEMLDYLNSSAGLKVINKFLNNSADIFDRFSKAVVPFLDGFLRLMNALAPAGRRLADRITDLAERFQDLTQAEGFGKRIDDAMKRAEKTAGLLFKVIGNLGSALSNVFTIANPSTNTFLQMLVDATQRFEDFTDSVGGQESITKWAEQSVEVMRQFGRTLEAVFEVVAELADPRVIISFLKTVEGAFNLLGKLPLDKIVQGFVSIAEALQPVSSLFLAIVIGGAALNILIGSLIGQVGGLVGVLAKIVKFKILTNILRGMGGGAGAAGAGAAGAAKKTGLLSRAWGALVKIFAKMKAAFSSVTGFFTKTSKVSGEAASKAGKLSGVFKPVLDLLGRFARFAGPVGIAVWIGTIIAGSERLQEKLGGVFDALKRVGSSLADAFREIGTALKPLAPVAEGAGKGFGAIFGFLDKLVGLAVGLFLDTLIFGFDSLANVIKGLGSIFAGFINVLVGLFTLDFGKIGEGFKQIFSGLGPLIKGAVGLFLTFFAPARLLKIGAGALKGLGKGIAKVAPTVLTTIAKFIGNILKFFITLPFRLLSLGGQALVSLTRGIATRIPGVLAAIGRLVLGVLQWVGRLPGRLLSLGVQAVTKLGGAIGKNAPKVISAAGRIVMGVLRWIARLPGRLFTLGVQAITRLGSAVRTGVGKLRTIAGEVVDSVFKTIKDLPGKLLGLGGELLTAGKTLGGKILEGVGNGLKAIGDMAGNIAASLKTGINNAIGLPKSISLSILGKKVGFTIPGFERGTNFAPGGMALVGEGGPELIDLPRGSKVYPNSRSERMMGGGLPKKVVLRIGAKDFVAYVEEIASDVIDSSDSLAWQGA